MKRIVVENLSKKFYIGSNQRGQFLSKALCAISGRAQTKELWALVDVSFSVLAGEMIGIIGKNGAGKSTLLSVIAGIYERSGGTLTVNGKVISVIGLVNGLRDRLTMRDNIYLCCALFGLSRRTTNERFDSIVELTELTEYTETKLYQFSAGMKARLVFSMAIHCDPEILLFDEIIANLDIDFVERGKKTLSDLRKKGVTILSVSHIPSIMHDCNRILWLHEGRLIEEGPSEEIIKRYWKEHA